VAWGIFPRVRPVFGGVFKVWLRIEFISIVVLVSWLGMLIMLAGKLVTVYQLVSCRQRGIEMGTLFTRVC
jgi:hypothetical protein